MKPMIVVAALLASGCVTTRFHEQKMSEAESLRAAQEKAGADREKKLGDERDALRKQADDLTALTEQLKGRLEKLGQNVDKLTSEKGQLAAGLDDARQRLEELRKQKAAAEARAQVFRNLVEKLHAMIPSGQPDGQVALGGVAQALATIADRRFLVAGHTDNVPIHSAHFPSNWELSTARAVEVTKLLIADGMNPKLLAAAGYGEFDPVAPNGTPEHKASNRRIEIVLQPNLSDLPPLDDIKTN